MKKLSKKLIEIGKEICNEEKKEIEHLTNDEREQHKKAEKCYICGKRFSTNKKSKCYQNFEKVRDHCHCTRKYRGAAHSLCDLRHLEQSDILVILHNESNYDFHLLIKDLAKEHLPYIKCLGENTEKYISFSLKIDNPEYDEDNKDEDKPKSYNLRFADSFRFLESLTDKLSEINNKTCVKCKERDKSTQYCEFVNLDMNRLRYKCLKCEDIPYKSIQPVIVKFPNTYRLSNKNNEKFILLLRKGVYPYEYMDNWDRCNENALPSKEKFHIHLYMQCITDNDYNHAKNVWNIFNMLNLGDYHDLFVQSDTLLLSDIFEECRKTCIREYELDPCYFVSVPGLAWEACLKIGKIMFKGKIRITNRY